MQDGTPANGVIPIDRNTFEDNFPVMFQFYKERGKLNEEQHQKVQEIQSRWKAGLVFWLTSDNKVIEIPDWVAMNVVINNKSNIFRSSRICMSLNHTKGYGCNRLNDGTCSYIHECVLCGCTDHGVFQKRPNGTLICKRLRKWNEEEERFKLRHGDTHAQEEKLSDMAQRGRDHPSSSTQSSSPTHQQHSNGALRPLQSKHEQMQKVKTLCSTTGCSEQQALELLTANRWIMELAANAYFERHDGSSMEPSGLISNSGNATSDDPIIPTCPAGLIGGSSCWGVGRPQTPIQRGAPKAERRPSAGGQSPSSLQSNLKSSTTEDLPAGVFDLGPPWEDTTPSPPPAQPPPPRMPPNWQALWSEQHQAYYFWNMTTSKTTWEAPSLEGTVSPTSATSSNPMNSPSEREAANSSNRSEEGFSMTASLPGLNGIGPLVGSCSQHPNSHERNNKQGDAHERSVGSSDVEPTRERSDAERKAEELWSCRDGHYLCTQHWWPPEGADTCMRLFHGEHVTVTWTDGNDNGWAYGHTLDKPSQEGYFPQAILKEVKRPPQRRRSGDSFIVAERFEAPAGETGYLTVEPGDVIKLLKPMEAPSVWAYSECRKPSGVEIGWVPDSVLDGVNPGDT